jgi:hypothetical protein
MENLKAIIEGVEVIEFWKDIEGFRGFYQISSFGRVMSMPRVIIRTDGKKCTVKQRILSHCVGKCGYCRVALSIDGRFPTLKVHRLVAEAFIPNPENKPEVNHKRGNKQDNRFWMLEWNTKSENVKHSFETGLNNTKGTKNGNSKLTADDIPKIRQMFRDGLSSRKIADKYGMDKTVFNEIRNGKRWSHVE